MRELELYNTRELSRLLWRRESGMYEEVRVAEIFENEVNRLESLIVELRPALRSLRHTPSRMISTCDDAIDQAQRLNLAKDYENSLQQIRRAQEALEKLSEVLAASAEFTLTREAYDDLETLLDSAHLQNLVSIRTLAHLLVEIDTLLAAGICRQAEFMARVCKNRISALVETGNHDNRNIDDLRLQISSQLEFCTKTEEFAPSALVDVQLRHGLERLSDLLNEGRVRLVTHLTEDIECQLGSRRTVLSILQGATNRNNQLRTVNTKRLVRDESWDAAACYLLDQSLEEIGIESTQLGSEIQRITQKLSAFSADSTATTPDAGSGTG